MARPVARRARFRIVTRPLSTAFYPLGGPSRPTMPHRSSSRAVLRQEPPNRPRICRRATSARRASSNDLFGLAPSRLSKIRARRHKRQASTDRSLLPQVTTRGPPPHLPSLLSPPLPSLPPLAPDPSLSPSNPPVPSLTTPSSSSIPKRTGVVVPRSIRSWTLPCRRAEGRAVGKIGRAHV